MITEERNTQRRLTLFLVLLVSLTAIFSSVTFYAMSTKPSQSFIGFGIQSRRGLQDYIPNGNPNSNLTVATGQTMNWTFSVTNRMNKAEFILIITRIGNLSSSTPNETTPSTPQTTQQLGSTEQFINDGEISRINFSWTVESSYLIAGQTYLNVSINGQQSISSAPVSASQGRNFRLIFELWTFDSISGSFQYGYPGQASQVGSWLQVWFNAS